MASDAYYAKVGRPADSVELLVKLDYLKSVPASTDYTLVYGADTGDVTAEGLAGCP